MVNDVFDDKTALEAAIDAFIEQNILPKSAVSLRYAVRAARVNFNHHFVKYLAELEKIYVEELMTTKDANEGINSFIEKRKPVWLNH